MKKQTREFLLKEYSHLRGEVLETLKEIPANEKWALVTSGVFWAWLAAFPDRGSFIPAAAWVPVVLTFLLFLRWRAIERKFETYRTYLLRLETAFELEGFGWEHHIQSAGKHEFRYYGWGFWCLLFAGNVFLAVWASCHVEGAGFA